MKEIIKATRVILIIDATFLITFAFPRTRENMAAMLMFACCLTIMTVLNFLENAKKAKNPEATYAEGLCIKIVYCIGILFGIIGVAFIILSEFLF